MENQDDECSISQENPNSFIVLMHKIFVRYFVKIIDAIIKFEPLQWRHNNEP